MFTALQNVVPSHLMDAALHDFRHLRATGVAGKNGDKAFDDEPVVAPGAGWCGFVLAPRSGAFLPHRQPAALSRRDCKPRGMMPAWRPPHHRHPARRNHLERRWPGSEPHRHRPERHRPRAGAASSAGAGRARPAGRHLQQRSGPRPRHRRRRRRGHGRGGPAGAGPARALRLRPGGGQHLRRHPRARPDDAERWRRRDPEWRPRWRIPAAVSGAHHACPERSGSQKT